MPRVCTVCTHPERQEIDRCLAVGEGAKRRIAARYSLSETSIRYHEARHLGADLIEAARAKVSDNGTDKSLVGRVTRMVDRLEKLAEACTDYGAAKDLMAVARELRPYHELFGRANGQLANDRINAMFINWGVRDETEVKQALDLKRSMGEVNPETALDEIEAAIRMALPQARHRITSLRTVLDEIEGMSYAEEVNGNGHKG